MKKTKQNQKPTRSKKYSLMYLCICLNVCMLCDKFPRVVLKGEIKYFEEPRSNKYSSEIVESVPTRIEYNKKKV